MMLLSLEFFPLQMLVRPNKHEPGLGTSGERNRRPSGAECFGFRGEFKG
jgi:hypothetical protein